MKKLFVYLFIFSFLYFLPSLSSAQENNKVGIFLLQPTSEDVLGASTLANSQNGDWGYVTLVIQENDRDIRKWQDLFEQLREKHLIPLIRLATSPQGEVWRKPEEEDAKEWVDFLNKLNWVVKKRYVILFNEQNHASEWGGEVSPEGYGKVALAFAKQLKASNKDYFVILGGLDAAAPQYPAQFWDSGEFMKEVCKEGEFCKELFKYIDGWSSHSYPNPGFSGSVWDSGKKSIRGYEYELALLKELGIEKDLPVFITETGWKQGSLSEDTIAENYRIAFEQVWDKDNRIQAVTPFVFKYLSEPFIGFSWKNDGGYSAQYEVVKNLPKKKGKPEQIEEGSIDVSFPSTLIARSTYHFSVFLKNGGQAIWDQEEGYMLSIKSNTDEVKTLGSDITKLKPFEEDRMNVTIKTPSRPQTIEITLLLKKNGVVIMETNKHTIKIEPFPSLTIKTSIFPKMVSNGEDFEVHIFNMDQELVFLKKGLSMRKGTILVENIADTIPGHWYRIVLIGYPYIPRQEIKMLYKGINNITLKKLFPFDSDGNGKMNFNDLKVAIMNPNFFQRFIPWNQQ